MNPQLVASEEELREVLAEVRRLAVFARRRAASAIAGGYRSAFKGAGLEFDQVREYAEGDDPRTVDWNVTARMGRPFVKTFVDERDRLVLLAIDVHADMDAGLGWSSARRAAASIVAMLALSAADLGDRVGAVHFADGFERWAQPRRGAAHALRIVRDTLLVRPALHREPAAPGSGLTAALANLVRLTRGHAILFVVTDGLRPLDGNALARAARRHAVVVVRIVPAELAPGRVTERIRMAPAGGGPACVVDLTSAERRAQFDARVADHARALRVTCERSGADLVEVDVPFERDPARMLRPLVELFRRREARAAHG